MTQPTWRDENAKLGPRNDRAAANPAPTWRQHHERTVPTTRDDLGPNHSSHSILRLPSALARHWRILRELESRGAEADLLIVESFAGEQRVAKIYRAGIEPKTDVLQRLGGAPFEHVVKLFDHGRSDGRSFELLEYVHGGSLEDLIGREGPQLDEMRVGQIVVELLKAIQHLHANGVVHRDLKPSNILVRSVEPFDLVLTDFGIASVLGTGSRRFTTGHRTIAYASPEAAAGEVSKASDWWSLGIMLVEMLTGRHPFGGSKPGDLLDERAIMSRLAQMPVDQLVEGINEPWRALCRGLLRREAKNRWTDAEIVRWVRQDPTLVVTEETSPSQRSVEFYFAGGRYASLPEIGRAFGANWTEAKKTVERGHLLNWVKDDLKDNEWRQFLTDLDRDCSNLDERVFRIIVKLDPSGTPSFRGISLDALGLKSVAEGVLASDNTSKSLLEAIYDRNILIIAAEGTGIAQYRQLDEKWRDLCRQYQSAANAAAKAAAQPTEQKADLAQAAMLLACLPEGRQYLQNLRLQVSEASAPNAHECAWFRELGEVARASAPILFLMLVLAPSAKAEADRQRQKREHEAAEQQKQKQWSLMRIKLIIFLSGYGLALGLAMVLIRKMIWSSSMSYWTVDRAFHSLWDGKSGGESLIALPIFGLVLVFVAVFMLASFLIARINDVNRDLT